MGLEKQILDILVGGTLQTKVAKELVQPGSMLEQLNTDFRRVGAISKRNGYSLLQPTYAARATSIGASSELGTFRDTLIQHSRVLGTGADTGSAGFTYYRGDKNLYDYGRQNNPDLNPSLTPWNNAATPRCIMHSQFMDSIRTGVSIGGGAGVGSDFNFCDSAILPSNPNIMVLAYTRLNVNGAARFWRYYIASFNLATKTIDCQEQEIDIGVHSNAVWTGGFGPMIRLVTTSSGAIYVLYNGLAANIFAATITVTGNVISASAGSSATTAGAPNANTRWDACASTHNSTGFLIAFRTAAATTIITRWDSPGVGASSITYAFNSDAISVDIAKSVGQTSIVLAFLVVGVLRVVHINNATMVQRYAPVIPAGIGGTDVVVSGIGSTDTAVVIGLNTGSVSGPEPLRIVMINAAGAILATTPNPVATYPTFTATGLVSKGYASGQLGDLAGDPGQGVFFVVQGPRLTRYLIRVTLETVTGGVLQIFCRTVATFDVALVPQLTAPVSACVSLTLLSLAGPVLAMPTLTLPSPPLGAGGIFSTTLARVNVTSFSLAPCYSNPFAEINGNLHIANASPIVFDGEQFDELGFTEYPTLATAFTSAAVGGFMSNGTYSFVACYVHVDSAGNRVRGPISDPVSITLAGGTATQIITGRFSTYLEQNRTNVHLEVYSTTAGGTIYYLTSVSAALTFPPLTFTRSIADATLSAGELLYTTGGVLENVAPPAASSACINNNRLFFYCDNDLVYFTKKAVPGTAMSFTDSFFKRLVTDGSIRTTLATMDGRIIALRENSVQYFDGDGPTDNGQNDTFSDVRMIPGSVGCLPNTPACVTDKGIFFKSVNGIQLLTRSLQIEDIGTPVEAYDSQALIAITDFPEEQKVKFEHSGAGERTLVYDYLIGQWTTESNSSSVGYRGATRCRVNSIERYCRLFDDVNNPASLAISLKGTTANDYKDLGQVFALDVSTPWIRLEKLLGTERVWHINLLGILKSTHRLNLEIYKDYSELIDQTVFYNTTEAPGEALTFRHHYGKRCAAIKLRVYDSNIVGESLSLTGISLELGMKRGTFKLPAVQTV